MGTISPSRWPPHPVRDVKGLEAISRAARRRDAYLPSSSRGRKVDPALMTWREYRDVIDASRKNHPSDAYATQLEDLAHPYLAREGFDILIQRFKSRGLRFELRAKEERINYCKRTDDDLDYLRDERGDLIPYTDEEIAAAGLRPFHHTIAIFDAKGVCVGAVQDEWGCVLVRVAREYAGFGFGVALTKVARGIEPEKPSGGFTPQGYATCLKTHREFVRDALVEGRYRKLVAAGELTKERALEIVRSAGLEKRLSLGMDVATDDPSNWAIYGSEHGAFVVYDKRLKDFVEEGGEAYDHWMETALKGYVLARVPGEVGLLVQFGGETPAIKRFMMACASAYCEREGVPLAVDMEDVPFIDASRMTVVTEPSNRTGAMRVETRATGDVLDIEGIATVEAAWRKQFDRYGEFHDRILELAEARFSRTNRPMAEEQVVAPGF